MLAPAPRPTIVRFVLLFIVSATFASVTPPAIERTVFGQATLSIEACGSAYT